MISPVKIWRNQKHVTARLGKTGTIVAWTVIRVPPAGFSDQAPYPVVLVKLTDGTHMTAQLVDPPATLSEAMRAGWTKDPLIGVSVITVVRRIMKPNTDGVIPYGIKVKPL